MNDNISILKRLYKDYTSKFIKKIFYAVLLTVVLAASTSSIAYLLDPAIKKIFIVNILIRLRVFLLREVKMVLVKNMLEE